MIYDFIDYLHKILYIFIKILVARFDKKKSNEGYTRNILQNVQMYLDIKLQSEDQI